MMEMMSWSATISPCAKGSKLFESFDMDFYNEKCAEYDALPQTEKGKYKSRDAYVVIQGGPNLTALNKAYLKLNNEIDSRLKDSSIPERLSIDLLIQQVSPQYSLLISKYLRLFEIKYPMLVSELITNYVPVIAEK